MRAEIHEVWTELSGWAKKTRNQARGRVCNWREEKHRPSWWLLNFLIGAIFVLLLSTWVIGGNLTVSVTHLLDRATGTMTLGFLLIGWIVLTRSDTDAVADVISLHVRLWKRGALWACAWLLCALADLAVSYINIAGASGFRGFVVYATETWSGGLATLQVITVALLVMSVSWATAGTFRGVLVILVGVVAISVSALVPGELYGRQGDWQLITHVLVATGWVGGLAALIVYAGEVRHDTRAGVLDVVRAYSELAFAAALIVGLTGVGLSLGWLRSNPWGSFLELPEGRIIQGKVLFLAGLMTVGALQRGIAMKRLAHRTDPSVVILVILGLLELVVMGAAFGAGIALSTPTS